MFYGQEASTSYVGAKDGRFTSRQSRDCTAFYQRGFDVFGPWTVQTRRTGGGVAVNKRWGLVFTCLVSRAIHIELLETMDASSFICALRRFFSIRGPALRLRCDRCSNFVGAKTELDESLAKMDKQGSGEVPNRTRLRMAIQSTAPVPFRRSLGAPTRYNSAHPGRHAVRDKSTETDPRATRCPDIRGNCHC